MQIKELFCTETVFIRNLTRVLLVILPIVGISFGLWVGYQIGVVAPPADNDPLATTPLQPVDIPSIKAPTDEDISGNSPDDITGTPSAPTTKPDPTPTTRPLAVSSFAECKAAGYAIMESFPPMCRDGAGTLHVEKISN